jgi:hypothetical protein
MMTNMTRITFVQLVTGLAKGCMTVLLATNAKELAAIQNNTGILIMTNWPFNYPPVPWTKAQEQAYQQAQRAQLLEAPL